MAFLIALNNRRPGSIYNGSVYNKKNLLYPLVFLCSIDVSGTNVKRSELTRSKMFLFSPCHNSLHDMLVLSKCLTVVNLGLIS
jgi:hypothetical protein